MESGSPSPPNARLFFGRRVLVTTVPQAGNAPFIDRCTSVTAEGECFRGRCIVRPFLRDRWGQRPPQPGLVIARREVRRA